MGDKTFHHLHPLYIGVVRSVDFDKCIVTYVHHYNIAQSTSLPTNPLCAAYPCPSWQYLVNVNWYSSPTPAQFCYSQISQGIVRFQSVCGVPTWPYL